MDKTLQICSFRIQGDYFGVDIRQVSESMYMREDFTQVPTTNPFLLGVINQRGNVVPIISINDFLDLEESKILKNRTILILQHERMQVGIIADSVAEIINVAEPNLEETKVENEYIKSVFRQDEKLISILNVPKLLTDAKKQVV